jgi:hypothetical protein
MRASQTAKMLTIDMVEGKTPISYVIDQYSNVKRESVRTLLTRLHKLYYARSEVKRILSLVFKVFHCNANNSD